MEQERTSKIDKLWGAVERWFPILSVDEQRAGLSLLRELAKGEPVTKAQFGSVIGKGVAEAEALVSGSPLRPFIKLDEEGRIQGFWGLSVATAHHRFTVKGRSLWTWCAQDSLVMPELLGETAEIDSPDPGSGELVRLTVSPTRVEAANPTGIVVSHGDPDAWNFTSSAHIRATVCHFIYFFASRASAERWQEESAKQHETVLLTLDEAFRYGERINNYVFGPELARLAVEAVS